MKIEYQTRGDLKEKRSLATLANGLEISISQFSKPLAIFSASTQKTQTIFLYNLHKYTYWLQSVRFHIKTIKQEESIWTCSFFRSGLRCSVFILNFEVLVAFCVTLFSKSFLNFDSCCDSGNFPQWSSHYFTQIDKWNMNLSSISWIHISITKWLGCYETWRNVRVDFRFLNLRSRFAHVDAMTVKMTR